MTFKERDTLSSHGTRHDPRVDYPYYNLTTPHRESIRYPSPGDMLGSFVDLIMRTFISSKFRQYFILCHPLFSIVQFCIYCSIYLIIYLDLSFIFQEFKLYWVRFLLICLIFPFRITCSQIYYTLQSFNIKPSSKYVYYSTHWSKTTFTILNELA